MRVNDVTHQDSQYDDALFRAIRTVPFEYTYHLKFTPSVMAALTLSFITFASYLFYNYALRRVPIGRISLMYPLTGPIGATSAWIVIDAEITLKIFISITKWIK